MNIIIPMAGEGSRFSKSGYLVHKPELLISSLRRKGKLPMVVAAALDVPFNSGDTFYFIGRDFHQESGTDRLIEKYVPRSKFIALKSLTRGQASTCLIASEFVNNDAELFIASCDNGMIYDQDAFKELRFHSDVIVFTHRFHDCVLEKPEAYGWIEVVGTDRVTGVSVKKSLSSSPMNDHAIVGSFWFKRGSDFINCAHDMITHNDLVNNEFYVDLVIKYALKAGLMVRVFEVRRYLCWGTPKDYEDYERTVSYWEEFLIQEGLLTK